ncbi:GerW family sporulation protein [Sporomusa acidovorans]|uniref:Sporulation protein YtfJ n=1 Tax=Sporomusa acidovorans (strain ATCC 49682 / DSM 3132 / Mol) TaxID=1123286 RepID=A0ABZ3J6S0_SPOA4|nr:spore germination protein GerW family protein [Sporomusa acidovorans]OZC21056.1 sporulation protein YtfJ [Sporomusa acidovorans DSM 3132]SDF17296.1 Uncharacterized spore protein YtfJ [Sporomusa acidovorans]
MSTNSENFVKENLNAIFANFEKFISTKTVVGEPVKIGDTTLVPLIDVCFGAGTGGGDGTDEKGCKGIGGGGGGGAKISPAAVLVIRGDKVDMLPVKKGGSFEKLIDMVPEIVTKFNCGNNAERKNDSMEE